ncbi:CMP-N-acetylneuraminate-beta-galactosamide-alpha-2,3-sialyltransferase 4-like [Scyliorhinus torazame]|uniref:CMP-N-acetylneuraminate-beta-galactosamide- alpha-2,3-sialyltransferase 4-like n=1 Tax=Scyliorhinus torazame TaxID=75743 RepID=UPI003B5BD719
MFADDTKVNGKESGTFVDSTYLIIAENDSQNHPLTCQKYVHEVTDKSENGDAVDEEVESGEHMIHNFNFMGTTDAVTPFKMFITIKMTCWNKNKRLFRFVSVVLILLILTFHWNGFLWISLQLAKFHMKVSLPIQATQCSTWQSNNRSEQILPKFIRNTNLFLSIDGDWWKKPNYLFHTFPYGIKGNEVIVKKILVRTESHMPDEIDRLNCKRCVIIGNGNTLRNSSIGQTINEYDVVIRLNNAPVRGYEKDVGNKTTLRIFYPESATENTIAENNLDTLFVFVPFKTVDVRWLKAIVYNETKVTSGFWKRPGFLKNLNPAKVRMLNPFYISQAAIQFLGKPEMIRKRGSHPTTGLLAITLGLNYCDEVHAAGFGYPLNQKNGLIHYFDRINMKQMSGSLI